MESPTSNRDRSTGINGSYNKLELAPNRENDFREV